MYSTISSSNTSEMFAERIRAQKAEKEAFGNSVLAQVQGNYCSGGLKSDVYICKDGNDDGRISFSEKLANFGKGLVAPIKNIFASPKNMAVTALTVAAGAGLIALTGGMAAPVMVAIGLIGGGAHIVSGLYKQATATTDAQAAQAWQQVGSGTFTVGASAIGAKSSLKAAGVENTANMSTWQACVNCLKNAPKFFSEAVSTASPKVSAFIAGLKKTSPKNTTQKSSFGGNVEGRNFKKLKSSKVKNNSKSNTTKATSTKANPPRVIELPEKMPSNVNSNASTTPDVIELPEKMPSNVQTENVTTSVPDVIELPEKLTPVSETKVSATPDVIELPASTTPRLGLPAPKNTPEFNSFYNVEQQLPKNIKMPFSSNTTNEVLGLPPASSNVETVASTPKHNINIKLAISNVVDKVKNSLKLFGLFID